MFLHVFNSVEGLISTLMTAIGSALYTWYGVSLVIAGGMTVGEFTAFTMYVGYLYQPITAIVGLLVPYQEFAVASKRFYEVYDVKSEIEEPENPVEIEDLQGHVVFSNVHFAYGRERPILQNINLNVAPGQKVALVGSTGAGKSTLVSLLPRFYTPEQGTITIDGVDIQSMSVKSLRNQIGTIMQHPFLFTGSIFENITAWQHRFREEQVIQAAKDACAHEFITSLPEGYQTKVGENGVNLSGGERQRIAMARVFLLNRPILILDEATSSLDTATEALIQQALQRLCAGKTTFLVAHRLSTIKDADLILVMEQGQIVERGQHQALIDQQGVYYQLYHNSGHFI